MIARKTPYTEKLDLDGLPKDVEFIKHKIDLFITNSNLADEEKIELIQLFNMISRPYVKNII